MDYDFKDFLMTPVGKRSREQCQAVAEELSDILNTLIVTGYEKPALIKDAERRFGMAQCELSKLARELRS